MFDNVTYASMVTGVYPNYSDSFLEAEEHKEVKKIVIQRTFRYRNNLSADF